MNTIALWEKLGGRLAWVREHRRLRAATRRALAESESFRGQLAVALNELRLQIRRRQHPSSRRGDGRIDPGLPPREPEAKEAKPWWH